MATVPELPPGHLETTEDHLQDTSEAELHHLVSTGVNQDSIPGEAGAGVLITKGGGLSQESYHQGDQLHPGHHQALGTDHPALPPAVTAAAGDLHPDPAGYPPVLAGRETTETYHPRLGGIQHHQMIAIRDMVMVSSRDILLRSSIMVREDPGHLHLLHWDLGHLHHLHHPTEDRLLVEEAGWVRREEEDQDTSLISEVRDQSLRTSG